MGDTKVSGPVFANTDTFNVLSVVFGISEHQPALKEAKEISFSIWNLNFHGRAAQAWFESEL